MLSRTNFLRRETCSHVFSLPTELLDQIFYDLEYTDRWCFALSCKAAAGYAIAHPRFLEIPTALTSTSPNPTSSLPLPSERISNWRRRGLVTTSKAYSDIMRILSIGWVDKNLHWCDHCRRFKPFPTQTRGEWYVGQGVRVTVDTMRHGGGWVQDIGLSSDGFISWNHSCPPCAERWLKSVSNAMAMATFGKQVSGSKQGSLWQDEGRASFYPILNDTGHWLSVSVRVSTKLRT